MSNRDNTVSTVDIMLIFFTLILTQHLRLCAHLNLCIDALWWEMSVENIKGSNNSCSAINRMNGVH